MLNLYKLISEVFGSKNIEIEIKMISGGSISPIRITTIKSIKGEDSKYFILIYNCGDDGSIKSYILDQRNSILKAGYKKIVGIRDVYPHVNRNEIQNLLKGLNYKLPQKDLPIKFVLCVMEIEAWFLAEKEHYKAIHESLTQEKINHEFGFDPDTKNTELFDEPANLLNSIYNSVGKSYTKKQKSISRTVESLYYSNVYFSIPERINSLNSLIVEIEEIFI